MGNVECDTDKTFLFSLWIFHINLKRAERNFIQAIYTCERH